jgi:hypothetical protein
MAKRSSEADVSILILLFDEIILQVLRGGVLTELEDMY